MLNYVACHFSRSVTIWLLPPPPKVIRGYLFAGVGRYNIVCEQLSGANSSPIVTELCQSHPSPQRTRRLNFGRSRCQRSRSVGEVCALLSPSSIVSFSHLDVIQCIAIMKTNMVFSIVLYLYAFGSGVVLFSNDPVERWSDFNPFIV